MYLNFTGSLELCGSQLCWSTAFSCSEVLGKISELTTGNEAIAVGMHHDLIKI